MRRKRLRIFLLAAVVLSLGGVAYKVGQVIWLAKAREFQKNSLQLLDYAPEAALQVKDFHRTQVEEGRTVWEISGEEARYLKAKQEALIKNPVIVYHHKNGKTTRAAGNEGHLFFQDQGMEKMQLEGEIQINYQGFVLATDEILYLKSEDQMVSPGKVVVKGKGVEVEGVGMEISLQDETIRLLRNVKTKIRPDEVENFGASSNG